MRTLILAAPLLLAAAPTIAQPAPPRMLDPNATDRLVNMTQALSNALLNVPVGDVEAAAEGRQPNWADRHRTIRDVARQSNPNFDRDLQRGVAEAGPQLRSAQRAVATTLPQVLGDLSRAANDIDRAMQNMPRPHYPRQ